MMSANRGLVRSLLSSLSMLVAIFCIGWTLRFLVGEERPIGRVEGRILLDDLKRPLKGVQVVLAMDHSDYDYQPVRRVRTDADGRFVISRVTCGTYRLTASTRAHEGSDTNVIVEEGKTTYLNLGMKHNEPDLEVMQHQKMYGTREHANVSIRGYIDPQKFLAVPSQRDTVHLRIYATRLSEILGDREAAQALEQVGSSYRGSPSLPLPLLKPKQVPAPRLVVERDLNLDKADREGFYYQKLDLAKLGLPERPGVYLLDFVHGKQTACTWLLVTDTALVIKRAGAQMLDYVVDMQSGAPLANCDVRSYRNGAVVTSGKTNAHGLAQMTLPSLSRGDEVNSTRAITVAFRGDDEAVVQGNTNREGDDDPYTVYTYTDRTVYRPGQRIYFKGIVRRDVDTKEDLRGADLRDAPDLPPNRRYRVPAGLPVQVEIRDKGGERLLQQRFLTNRYGSYFGQLDLLKEAATGVYTLVTKIGGKEHTTDIYVASYQKPEFAVTVTPEKKYSVRGAPIQATIEGKYYFGAPVAGAKVHYSIYSTPDWRADDPETATEESDSTSGNSEGDSEGDSSDRFRYRGYRSDSYYGGFVQEGEVTLDASGRAVVTVTDTGKGIQRSSRRSRGSKFSASAVKSEMDEAASQLYTDEHGPQELIYTISATVTAKENRQVEATGETHVVRGAFRLSVSPDGYLAEPGKPTSVGVLARDYSGKPVANQQIALEIGYESWKGGGYSYRKAGSQSGTTDAYGHATISITPPHDGNLQIVVRSTDAERHLVRGSASVWVSGDRGGDLDTTYDDLSLLTDRRRYAPGDTARVLINSGNIGTTVLLTVEGSGIHHAETIPITTHSTVVRVPILPQYGPNVFLAACYVKDKHFSESQTPLRVSTPASELTVRIHADRDVIAVSPDKDSGKDSKGGGKTTVILSASGGKEKGVLARYAPGDRITYMVETLDGKGNGVPAEVSFGVVDEAIYALRADHPGAIRQEFYPRRYNAVSTSYSFEAYYLGDADKTEPKIETRKKFPDTAHWVPDLTTNAQGRATISFQLPDSLTTWRATATAQTEDTHLGWATQKVVVSKDFLVRLETPRTLTQHDHSLLMAIVHNETDTTQTALVRLRTDGSNLKLSPVGENGQRSVEMPAHGSAEVSWPVVADGYGEAKLTLTAWTPKVAGKTQYTDGLERTLPIRPHGVEQVKAEAGELVTEAQRQTVEIAPDAIPGLNQVTVRITPSVASSLTGGLEYLIGYPYGCVEQTLSRVMPDLLVQRALGMRGLTLPEAEKPRARELNRMVQEGLQRLYRFQHPSGAWGWWEHDADDPWMTGYVLVGLATARSQGYPISPSVLKNGQDAAVKMLKSCQPKELPYLMYGLALVGERKAVADQRSRLPLLGMSSENLAYVDRIDTLLGHNDGAAYALLNKRAVERDGMVHWEQRDYWYTSDDLTGTAMALRVMVAHDPRDARIPAILRWLMFKRTDSYWSNTRDTSLVLAALTEYIQSIPNYSAGGQVDVQINGKAWMSLALRENNLLEKEIVLRVPSERLVTGKNEVTLTRVYGNSPIFYTVESKQTVPSAMQLHSTAQGSADLSVHREYRRISDRQSTSTPWEIVSDLIPVGSGSGDAVPMQVGDRIRVRLTITAKRDMDYVLIEDAFPAGCEVTERGDISEAYAWSEWWSSVDVRDDRAAFFARFMKVGTHTIEYNLRPQSPGTYHALPTLVQAMYAPEKRAFSTEATVEVRTK